MMRYLLAALALAFAAAAFGQAEEVPHPDARVERRLKDLGEQLRCLVCQNQTIAESNAGLALDLRNQIRAQIAAGRSDDEIRAYINDRFKDQGLLLVPPKTGVDSLVWVLPVVAVVLAAGGLAVAFRRWRTTPDLALTDEDRSIVERYRREHEHD